MIWRGAPGQNWAAQNEIEQCVVTHRGGIHNVLLERMGTQLTIWVMSGSVLHRRINFLWRGRGENGTFYSEGFSSVKIFHDSYINTHIGRFSIMEMLYVHWMSYTGPFNKIKALTWLLLAKEAAFSIANWCCRVALREHIILGSWAFLVPVLVPPRTGATGA